MWPILNMKPIHVHWARVLPIAVLLSFFILIIYALTRSSSCGTHYASDPDIKAVSYLCNSLTEGPANGDEGSVPTFKYRLEQVHVTIRHGDRFHLHTLPNYDMIHIPCNVSSDVLRHVPEMEGYVQSMQENAKRMRPDHPFINWDLYPNKAVCQPSHLTPKGAAQHVRNGAFLKSVYIRKWKLLNHGPELWDQVEMITTKKSRTLMSGLALLYAMLPELDLGKLSVRAANDNRICVTPVLPSPASPASVVTPPGGGVECECSTLQRYLNVVSGVYGQWLPAFTARSEVSKLNQEVADVLGTPVHTLPFISHIMDVSTVHMCHGLPLPGPPGRSRCFAPSTVRAVIDTINKNGAHRVRDPRVQRLSILKMHPLLQDMLTRMEAVMVGRTKRRFFLYSGHDSTIDPLAVALNVSDGSWPRYASRLVLELYSSSASNSAEQRDYFIKVLQDGRDMTGQTRGCEQLAPDGLCRFADFKAAHGAEGLKKRFKGQTYSQVCSRGTL